MRENARERHNSEIEWLRRMIAIRQFEERVEELIDRGEIIGVMHSSAGQEGVCVGACAALNAEDQITGTHRSHGHPIAKGAPLDRLMAELMGRRTGVCSGMGGSMHLADFSVGSLGESAIVGSSLPVAVGAGLAISMRGGKEVCLAFFGDGAAHAGICHEAMNMAAIWRLPVIFLCENNLYAQTTSFHATSSVKQIAERAASYGFPGEVVDGQDVRAVHDAVAGAVARARRGEGPSLIEAMTFRYGGHSYRLGVLGGKRDEEEYNRWRARDPILIHAEKLRAEGVMDEQDLGRLQEDVRAELDKAVAFARESPYPEPSEAWSHMYTDTSIGPMPAWPGQGQAQ